MAYHRLCESDYRFLSLIWDHEPVNSTELARICARELGWKKSTVYTVLRRLCEKGLFRNEGGAVTVLVDFFQPSLSPLSFTSSPEGRGALSQMISANFASAAPIR